MGLLESIRKWIDGETGEDLLEAADEHAKPRRVWEEFLVKIAREVEAAMQREEQLQLDQVRLDRRLHVGILQLAGQRRTVDSDCAVHLAE